MRSGMPLGGAAKVSATVSGMGGVPDDEAPGRPSSMSRPGDPKGRRSWPRERNRAGPGASRVDADRPGQGRAAAECDAAGRHGQRRRRGGEIEAHGDGAGRELDRAAGAGRGQQAAQCVRGREPGGIRAERGGQCARRVDEQLLQGIGGQPERGPRGARVIQAQCGEQVGEGSDRAAGQHARGLRRAGRAARVPPRRASRRRCPAPRRRALRQARCRRPA